MLEIIVIGGTKGKQLSESLSTIFEEFKEVVDNFKKIKYNIMDVNQMKFNDDFHFFKARMKELDKRLGSVIAQSFEDNDSLMSRIKLLDSFEEILERNLIEEEVLKKYQTICFQ